MKIKQHFILNSILVLLLLSVNNLLSIDNNINKILAEEILISTKDLPEFKTDIHSKESEGNQISGVVRAIFQDKKGIMCFGTQNGFQCLINGELFLFDIKDKFGKGITIKAIKQDSKGNLWIGHSAGLTKYDGEYFYNYTTDEGLISNDVWCVEVDSEDKVWIGTLEGLCIFDGVEFSRLDIPESIIDSTKGISSTKIIHSINKDSKNNIWIATNGGAYIYNSKELKNISETDGLCNNYVNSIIEDKNNNIWFATAHNGLCVYDGEKFIKLEILNNFRNKEIWNIFETKSGNILFSVKGEGVYSYNGKTIIKYNEENGLNSHAIMCIFQDNKNRIWFGGMKGVFRLENDKIINIKRNGPW